MSYQDMIKIANNPRYSCGVSGCEGKLVVAWGGFYGYNQYILKCSKSVEHGSVTRINRKEEIMSEMVREARGIDSKSLTNMDQKSMLERVNQAKFPNELKPDEKKLLATACITYGFDPIMHELSIYQGSPYVSADGRFRKAQETGLFDGIESRPATKQERIDWEIPDNDKFFRAEVWVKGASHSFAGWGRVRQAEIAGGKGFKPVETNPQRMAEKRAEVQALRKAFHIPLPSIEFIDSSDEAETVDKSTEGIIDSTAKVIKEEKSENDRTEQTPEKKKGSQVKIDMPWLIDSVNSLKWDILGHIRDTYKIECTGTLSEIINRLAIEQQGELVKEVEARLDNQ